MEWLSKLFRRVFPCGIDKYFDKLDRGMNNLVIQFDRIESKLDYEIQILNKELDHYKDMLESIGNTIPDMLWFKDLSGKYQYANKAIKQGLLFDINPIGKTDLELSTKAKAMFGDSNHTFGAKCANSDLIVITKALSGTFKKEDGRFLESGKIKGKMTYLEVFKAPKYKDGKLIGVVGTGRDITEYVEAFRELNQGQLCKMEDIFKRYEFEGENNE